MESTDTTSPFRARAASTPSRVFPDAVGPTMASTLGGNSVTSLSGKSGEVRVEI